MTTVPEPLDKPRCNCAVVGIYGNRNAAVLAYQALCQCSTAVMSLPASSPATARRCIATSAWARCDRCSPTRAACAASWHWAHNRYSTTGATLLHNAQPFLVDFKEGPAAISHNGNFTNTLSRREQLLVTGSSVCATHAAGAR